MLEAHRQEKQQRYDECQTTLDKNGQLSRRAQRNFKNQDMILTSLVRNLVGSGGLPLQLAEQEWFRKFMTDVEPRFQHVSRVAVKKKLEVLYEEEMDQMLKELATISFKPSVTLDFWTGRDGRSFMGCTVHYIRENVLKQYMLFFKEVPPPHTSENVRNNFEDQLDHLKVSSFVVVTDNAANMKCAFQKAADDASDDNLSDEDDDHHHDEDLLSLDTWTVIPLHFDGWIGCAAHKLQLVVHMGYKELLAYRRVQVAFCKSKSISTLSRQSSHFKYKLSARIPVPNETRWNSFLRHILKHFDNINEALNEVNKQNLMLTSVDKDNLSAVMQFFAEGILISFKQRRNLHLALLYQ